MTPMDERQVIVVVPPKCPKCGKHPYYCTCKKPEHLHG